MARVQSLPESLSPFPLFISRLYSSLTFPSDFDLGYGLTSALEHVKHLSLNAPRSLCLPHPPPSSAAYTVFIPVHQLLHSMLTHQVYTVF